LEALAAQLLAGFEPDVAGRAVATAVTPARRMLDAVERRQDVPRPIDAAADLDDLPVAALRAPDAAGIRTQLLLPEDQRRLAFGVLDRRATHAARIGGRRQAVLVGARAGAAIAGHRHHESIVAVRTGLRFAAHVQIPQTRRAFRRHAIRNDLAQAAERHV